jgi:hypothetical protein
MNGPLLVVGFLLLAHEEPRRPIRGSDCACECECPPTVQPSVEAPPSERSNALLIEAFGRELAFGVAYERAIVPTLSISTGIGYLPGPVTEIDLGGWLRPHEGRTISIPISFVFVASTGTHGVFVASGVTAYVESTRPLVGVSGDEARTGVHFFASWTAQLGYELAIGGFVARAGVAVLTLPRWGDVRAAPGLQLGWRF